MTPDVFGADLDLTQHLRDGDLVVWGQACGEPRTLTELLVRQAPQIGTVRCFVGIPAESAVTVETAGDLELSSYCGAGTNAALHAAGRLQIHPVHYSTLPSLLTEGHLRADVVLVQASPADAHGWHGLGLADDYFSDAIDTARVVIAEVNDQVPFTRGARRIRSEQCAAVVHTSRPPAQMPAPEFGEDTLRVASRVAELVPDGATLQFGIGALPEAVLTALTGHRDLGIHSGIINDAAMRLVRSGAANGSRKTHDRGVAIGGLFGGASELFGWAHDNPQVELRPTAYTHDPRVLATSHQLVAINAAIEVDLTGQVNAEVAGGRYVGAVGGAVDFLRGAAASRGGLPIVALPSTTRGASRIVHELQGPVSTPRSEHLVIVTEHGVADLRGVSLEQRVARMIAVADPAHRAALDGMADRVLASATRF